MKKVLITGADGQLGYELQRTVLAGYECIAANRSALDITDAYVLKAFVGEHKPDVIINSAAYTAVDKAEKETELAIAINTFGVANLANVARANSCKLVHISTDFVFDGKACSPYPVNAKTNPDSCYGKTKRDGEHKLISILGENALIMRTSWLYSSQGNNFVKTLLRLMQERESLGIIADQIGTPTWAHSLAYAVWKAIELNTTGIQHWSDAGVASWYDFAYAIMEESVAIGLLDKPIKINAITTADYPTPARRPCYSVMDKTTTWQALGIQSEHWRVALRRMLLELKEKS